MSHIKVMVSNPMLKIMKAALPDYRVSLEKMDQELYRTHVNYDLFSALQDLDNRTGRIKVFRIEYPAEFYACDRYISTNESNQIFRRSNRTMDGFIESIRNECEI